MNPLLSIIVPVFKEEKNVPEFLHYVLPILEQQTQDFEIIFSLDPSPDQTEEVIIKHHQNDPRIKCIKFSRRIGQPMAILAGLQYSSGDAVIVMDVDMQDPPELIPSMVEKWKEGYDVVMAQRRTRHGETWIKLLIAKVGYALIKKISDVSIPENTGEFRLMSRRVVDEVIKLKECHGFLRGLVALVGFKQTTILFDRPARLHGQGNYNALFGSLRIGFNGIFCFSTHALVLSTEIGFMLAIGSIFFAIIYFILKIFGFPFASGNPTIVILILMMGGIQLISIGILGEYIGRIYEEVRQRPKFIVDTIIGFKEH
ncbi:MAG: glycosyl transferase [Verrucomicrobia bacterium RIFCSPHIGHO2_12_FULL_41_10]|nr:MAG: glycosyl transferase [Verrucomicrobia bacterium RIFCSPHIGHO2_12_FULL_41_10]HLB34836.1 glycosyltransferase family 2 protein [Chthoniobacterales bacterium]